MPHTNSGITVSTSMNKPEIGTWEPRIRIDRCEEIGIYRTGDGAADQGRSDGAAQRWRVPV